MKTISVWRWPIVLATASALGLVLALTHGDHRFWRSLACAALALPLLVVLRHLLAKPKQRPRR